MLHKPPLLSTAFRFFGGTAIVLHFAAAALVIRHVWMAAVPPTDDAAHGAIVLLWGIAASGAVLGALFLGIAQVLDATAATATNSEIMARTIQRLAAHLRQESATEPMLTESAPTPPGKTPD